ncbi:hypothetical protein ABPG75_000524 [Micractinium tetrahymenae]
MPPTRDDIQYSERYKDDVYEYRHVILPQDIAIMLPKDRLLSEPEWRALGVQQSRGWCHFTWHRPERHILLFRRPKDYDAQAMAMRMAQYRAAQAAN